MKAKLIWSTLLASISLVVVAPTRAVAQSTPTVIKAKKIYTVTRGTLDNGEILIEAGKIQQVGSKVDAPADARHYSAEVVIPGMIDAHSHMALDRSGGNRGRPSGPVTAEWKAVDHFDPTSPMIPKSPSSVVFSLTPRSIRHWSTDSQIPVTLEAAVAAIRTTLDGAKQYLKESEPEEHSQRLEALRPLMAGEVPAIVQANTVEEIRAAMKLAEDYGFRLVVAGGVQAHQMASDLARADVGVILGNSGSNIGEYESIRGGEDGYNEQSPLLLSRAGVKVAFFSASGSRRVMHTGRLGGEPALNAAWAFRNGTPEQEALKMFTLNAAEMFDMGDRIGSIDVGKDADFMVLEGHPFDYRVLPQMVFIDGELVFSGHPGHGGPETTSGAPKL